MVNWKEEGFVLDVPEVASCGMAALPLLLDAMVVEKTEYSMCIHSTR